MAFEIVWCLIAAMATAVPAEEAARIKDVVWRGVQAVWSNDLRGIELIAVPADDRTRQNMSLYVEELHQSELLAIAIYKRFPSEANASWYDNLPEESLKELATLLKE